MTKRQTKIQLLERIADLEKELKTAKSCSQCCSNCPLKRKDG